MKDLHIYDIRRMIKISDTKFSCDIMFFERVGEEVYYSYATLLRVDDDVEVKTKADSKFCSCSGAELLAHLYNVEKLYVRASELEKLSLRNRIECYTLISRELNDETGEYDAVLGVKFDGKDQFVSLRVFGNDLVSNTMLKDYAGLLVDSDDLLWCLESGFGFENNYNFVSELVVNKIMARA